MKSFVTISVSALALIALGLILTNQDKTAPVSDSPEALALSEEGTRDVNAFRLRAAVEKLGQALELDPSLAEASIARVAAFGRLGERDNMEMELARADSLVGTIAGDNRRMLGQLRVSAYGDSDYRSLRDSVLARLEAEDPNNIYVLVALANKGDEHDGEMGSEEGWLKILEVDPNYANSYNMLGYMELRQGHYDQAIDYMQKYAFLAPDLANPHDSLGEVLMVMGR